jgi:hypothetical protein
VKKILTTAVSALLMLGSISAFAQDEAAEPNWTPVETFTCNFLEGKGPADLNAVIKEWNAWWDKKGLNNYFAATITPYYFGEKSFDIGWLGAWTDANEMGSSLDVWTTEGKKMNARFFEVLECMTHTNFASLNVKAPGGSTPDTMLLTFSDCSMKEGKTLDDFMAAQDAWNKHADEAGFETAEWILFPVAGGGDVDYDFKHVTSESNHTAVGANWQLYADGHYDISNELYGEVVECDSPRVYSATVARKMKIED